MRERIIIQNFAGIKSLDIDIKPINILIGPQATGKSICAKLLYLFKNFPYDLFLNNNPITKKTIETTFINKFQKYFPPENLSKGKFNIRYEIGNAFIEIERKQKDTDLRYSQEYSELEDIKNKSNYSSKTDTLEKNYFKQVEEKFGDESTYEQLFIPAGRSFFAILQRNIFTFLSSNEAIDPFLIDFGRYYENIKNSASISTYFSTKTEKEIKKNEEILDRLNEKILCGKYIREKGKDTITHNDGRKTLVANSSSGQQEMLPLAIILRHILLHGPHFRNGQSIYVEEPEAHLFPTAQRDMVDLMAIISNNSMSPSQFFITTHSPYILTSFNNLIQAGNIRSKLPVKKRNKLFEIVSEEKILKAEDVAAYTLEKGKCKSIFSDETGLISTNIIDDVSNELSVQFGNLLEIGE